MDSVGIQRRPCLICNQKFNGINSENSSSSFPPFPGCSPTNSSASLQSWSTFFIRRVLQLSDEECAELLQLENEFRHQGSSSENSWFRTCAKCSESVLSMFQMRRDIISLKQKMAKVQEEIVTKLKNEKKMERKNGGNEDDGVAVIDVVSNVRNYLTDAMLKPGRKYGFRGTFMDNNAGRIQHPPTSDANNQVEVEDRLLAAAEKKLNQSLRCYVKLTRIQTSPSARTCNEIVPVPEEHSCVTQADEMERLSSAEVEHKHDFKLEPLSDQDRRNAAFAIDSVYSLNLSDPSKSSNRGRRNSRSSIARGKRLAGPQSDERLPSAKIRPEYELEALPVQQHDGMAGDCVNDLEEPEVISNDNEDHAIIKENDNDDVNAQDNDTDNPGEDIENDSDYSANLSDFSESSNDGKASSRRTRSNTVAYSNKRKSVKDSALPVPKKPTGKRDSSLKLKPLIKPKQAPETAGPSRLCIQPVASTSTGQAGAITDKRRYILQMMEQVKREKNWRNDTTKKKRHRGRQPNVEWTCDCCDKVFNRLYNFRKHLEFQLQVRDHPCTFDGCNKLFNNNNDMQTHLLTHVAKSQRVRYECVTCGKSFWNGCTATRHMKTSSCPLRRYKRFDTDGTWMYGRRPKNQDPAADDNDSRSSSN